MKENKKILFLIPRMGSGGAERVVAILANSLYKRGYEVQIYTPTKAESFYKIDEGIKFVGEDFVMSKKRGVRQIQLLIYGILFGMKYRNKLKVESPDVVISFLKATNFLSVILRNKKYKLIVSERADPEGYSKINQLICKKLYPKADYIVCQSNKVADYYHSSKTTVIANPIYVENLPLIYDGKKEKEIVAVGRLASEKNFAMLIQAFSELGEDLNGYVLKIYGEGPERGKLEQLIIKYEMQDRILLMGASKNVIEQYKKAKVFVMSSNREGFPNALIEAMAMGIPVICTDFNTGVARELIDSNSGIIIPVNDLQALKNAVVNLLNNEEIEYRAQRNGMLIRERFDVENIVGEWEEIINY